MKRALHERVDEAFRSARATLRVPPTRFLVNLTERCQLKCAHCITHAPALTEAGTARSLGAEVLEALAPHLAHARYVGLTHAGEPTLAPLLDPFLALLRTRRAGAPTTVHVVTNGMALTEPRFRELCAAGISSWAFSLDGVTPQTNDALRIGARVEVLKERLRAFAALRRASGLDLRLGVSCTVTKSNLHELPAMVAFVADAGLDWLKLEETFASNERAAQEASLPPGALAEAARGAGVLCAERGVRFVDHTTAREVWKCEPSVMSESERAFSAADDFANRVDINPCRAPWEVVCIEPNGDVKPKDFHQPAAGNLLEVDLLTLWNSKPFVGRRESSAAHRRCDGRPTCPADPSG